MCIRDRPHALPLPDDENGRRLHAACVAAGHLPGFERGRKTCLLYTSDAADERSSVDLGGRRIIKKKKTNALAGTRTHAKPHNTQPTYAGTATKTQEAKTTRAA